MIPISLFPHESTALAAGKLGVLIRVVEPQPPSIDAVYKRAGINYSIFTDHHSKPGEFRVAGPVWAVREEMGLTAKKCPAGPKWQSPFGPPGTVLECREEWGYRGEDREHTGGERRPYDNIYIEYRDGTKTTYRVPWDTAKSMPQPPKRPEEQDDYERGDVLREYWKSWQSADSMPSWAVRLRPVVGEVRCVQLKDITEAEWRLWCPRDSLNPAWPVVADYHPAHAGEIELSEHYETEITESTWVWIAAINREEGS